LRAVKANLLVDRLFNQFNDAAHFMPGNRNAAENFISSLLMEAVAKENAGLRNEAMELLDKAFTQSKTDMLIMRKMLDGASI